MPDFPDRTIVLMDVDCEIRGPSKGTMRWAGRIEPVTLIFSKAGNKNEKPGNQGFSCKPVPGTCREHLPDRGTLPAQDRTRHPKIAVVAGIPNARRLAGWRQ